MQQRTVKKPITINGVGLHSGEAVSLTLRPAHADTGIVFVVDGISIKASWENVGETSYATTLEKDGVRVRTVEHLLAALAGLGIDNVIAEVTGNEAPILDGSAYPFVAAIKKAGIVTQDSPRRYLKILKAVTVHDGDKSASLLPSPVSRITYRIDFDHPMLADQNLSVEMGTELFEQEISPARTFGFLRDAEMLRQAGLAKGGSMDNAIIVDDEQILNPDGLRFEDEFVRHKMMDAVGDFSLAGMPIIGHLVADKSGHGLNARLVREVMSRPDCWMVVEGSPAYEGAEVGMAAEAIG
jgi:UDP-3-O-[3-hydroxymyristoyl] N-acetylglucosamine deacetylase